MSKDIETVELSIEFAKEQIALGEKALSLAENKLFIEVVLDGYMKDEAARLTGLLGDPEMKDHQDEIIKDLHGIASFQRYMRKLVRVGEMMKSELLNNVEALEEMRREDNS